MARISEVYVGAEFGRLVVLELGLPDGNGRRRAQVRCNCGTVKAVSICALGRKTFSCGCQKKESLKAAHTTHGRTKSPEYRTWHDMWDRCTNPNKRSYAKYKDRVPDSEWRDFEKFLADMGPKPTRLHTIERVNNDLGYGPNNCIWATVAQQNRNRSNNVYYTNGEVVLTLPDVALKLNQPKVKLESRLRRGWSPERALGTGWTLVKKVDNDVV